MHFFARPETWVLVSFILFFALLYYYRVHRLVLEALDKRAENIRKELEEARRLHEEARKLLAEYEAKKEQAGRDAKEILDVARQEAEAVALEIRQQFEDMMARKQQAAEERIALARDNAVREIRAQVAERAMSVAEDVLREELKGRAASTLLTSAMQEVEKKLH